VKSLSETMVKPLLQAADHAGVLGELLTMTQHDGSTCLHAVVDHYYRVHEFAKVLLQAADNAGVLAELLVMTDHEGSTCLHRVTGNLNVVEALVKAAGTAGVLGELMTMTDHKGRTCLHAVAHNSCSVRDVVKVLLRAARTACLLSKLLMMTDPRLLVEECGLNPHSADDSKTLVYVAAEKGMTDTVRFLVEEYGVTPNRPNW
jgi:hypothetical protein